MDKGRIEQIINWIQREQKELLLIYFLVDAS